MKGRCLPGGEGMKRRDALKMLGALVICLGGTSSLVKAVDDSEMMSIDTITKFSPIDYTFSSDGIRNLIIQIPNESDIIIPFSDIIFALKGG